MTAAAETEVFVHIDLAGKTVPVGRLWARFKDGKESATFEYDETWLSRKDRFSLEPALVLERGKFHTQPNRPIFGAFGDSAPDRWGKTLMQIAEQRAAAQEGRTPRFLREIDYLLGVNDTARSGGIRFSEGPHPGGTFLAKSGAASIPPILKLPRLLAAARRLSVDAGTADDLRLLLAPGSSLGGARPKASVLDRDGSLAIAKFPKKDDAIDVVRWEWVALTLAKSAGIEVPAARVEMIGNSPVLLVRRFDRASGRRIPFLSAMSMLGADDLEPRTYLEIADGIRRYGAEPRNDLRSLWRRLAFNILISNTDDHLRNHGFLYAGQAGWFLSPAYDLNPTPADIKPRILSTQISEGNAVAIFDAAVEVAPHFGLSKDAATKMGREIAAVVSGWSHVALRAGIKSPGVKRMASAFDHDDARKLGASRPAAAKSGRRRKGGKPLNR